MKNLGKAAIITAAIFLVFAIVGGIFIGFGAVRAFQSGDLNESVSQFVDSVQNYSGDDLGFNEVAGTAYAEIINGETTEIEFVNFAADVNFFPAPVSTSDVMIEYNGVLHSGSEGYYDITSEDGKVTIKENSGILDTPFSIGSIGNVELFSPIDHSGSARIYIPDFYTGKITIDSTAGELDFRGLTLDAVELSNTAGEVDFNNCVIGTLTCDDTVGEVVFDGELSGISIEDNIGECDIKSSVPFSEPCSIRNSLGEVNIKLPAESKLDVSSTNVLGEIDIDGSLRSDSGVEFEISNSLGEVNIKVLD